MLPQLDSSLSSNSTYLPADSIAVYDNHLAYYEAITIQIENASSSNVAKLTYPSYREDPSGYDVINLKEAGDWEDGSATPFLHQTAMSVRRCSFLLD